MLKLRLDVIKIPGGKRRIRLITVQTIYRFR